MDENNTTGIEEITEEPKNKRKTHTSTAVKHKYNNKTYDRITIFVRKEISEKYKKKCEESGIPYSKILKESIDEFLKGDEGNE